MSKFLLTAVVALGMVAGLAQAGAVGGPKIQIESVLPKTNDVYKVNFEVGTVKVLLLGDRGTDLDLYVYDGSGILLAKSEGPTDSEKIEFFNFAAGELTIKVVNRGLVSNKYIITTN